jgi:hypothetical protein
VSAILPSGSIPTVSRTSDLPADFLAVLCALAGGLLLAFPIVALGLSTFLLINLPVGTSRGVRLMLGTTAALAFSMMMGARPLDPVGSNDVDVYYEVYQELSAGRFEALGTFGGGLEVALPLLCTLWAYLLPPLSVNGLMFCCASTSALLLLLWIEMAFYRDRRWRDPALMGVCILLLNLYFSTQLTRQFMALIVLLYAFSARSRVRIWLCVAVAGTFHLTAIPFYAIYWLARRGRNGWIAILVLAFAFRIFFWQLVEALDIVPAAVAEKLVYYVDSAQEITDADLASLRMIGLLGVISVASVIASRFRPDPVARRWLAVPWITATVHFLLLPIPLASLRATLMIHSVAPGLIAYQMLWRRGGPLLLVTLNVLFVYKILTFVAAEDSGNLLSAAAMLSRFLL